MSVPFNTVFAETSLRINAIIGVVAATLESNYTISPLTTTQFQSTIFNFTAIKDAILDTEGRLAWAIANVGDHPWRQSIASTTADLANKATMPSTSTASKPIIGIWGAVVDSSDSTVCSEMPLDDVRRRATNADAQFVCPVYWFSITGGRIEHTRTNVKVECCIYSRSDQAATFTTNGNILLPDALAHAYVCGAVAMLVRDDEFAGQAVAYSGYFENTLNAISRGLTQVPSAVTTP